MDQTIKDFSNFFQPNKIKSKFIVNGTIDKAIKLVLPSFSKSNIHINTQIEKQFTCIGYERELLQVILNILNNTREAIVSKNRSNGVLDISIQEKSDMYIIMLQDNAGGISDEIIDRIFEPYFTTKFQDQGTGIGLYMCKNIIEKSMQGTLDIRNNKDGVLCTISIPKEIR